jgi:hypothetical protein
MNIKTKNTNLGTFCWGLQLQWKMLVCLMAVWSTTYTAIWYFYGDLVNFSVLEYFTKKNLATLQHMKHFKNSLSVSGEEEYRQDSPDAGQAAHCLGSW